MSSVALKEKELRHDLTAIYEAFKTRAEAVSAEVYRFATQAQALDFIIERLEMENIKNEPNSYAVWANSLMTQSLDKKAFAASIPGVKFEVTKEIAAQAKIGITEMNWALADTGTLVADTTAVDSRLASTLTEIHIAVISTVNIHSDLINLFKNVNAKDASYLSFITGPSRTSDIERILTIGVHGPARLIIVFVDELGGGK